MRIFLSYAAERLAVAQQVDAALEAEGHTVFFARDSIAASTRFGNAIREAVAESDLFVYLVSPESVEPGSYCLTELGFARERWPDPAGRVLPVLVAPTPPEAVPPYVQSLSALHPTGNLPAEVAASVERVGREHRRRRLRAGAIAAAALCAIAGMGAAVWARAGGGAATRPSLSVATLAEVRPAVAGEPALVLVRGNARNPSPRVDSIVRLDLDLEGKARAEPAGQFTPIHIDGGGGENFGEWFRISADGGTSETPRRWRVCAAHAGGSGRRCGPWSNWAEGPLSIAPPIAEGLRRRSRVVAAGNVGFLIGLGPGQGSPNELLVLGGGRDSIQRIPLPGEPAALAARAGRVAVGTRAPGVVVVLGPGAERSEHQVPAGKVGGSAASTGVASVALTERDVWVITGGSDGEPAVRLLDLVSRRWVPLPYAEDRFAFDARDIELRAGPAGMVWGVTTGTTPSSLYRLGRTGVVEIGGHQVSAVSCTGDVAPAADGTLRVMSCDGGLLRGRPGPQEFTTVAERDLRFLPFVKGDWRAERIAGAGDTLALAVTVLANDPSTRDPVPLVSRIGWSLPGLDRALIGFERDSLAVTSLAVLDTLALAAVTSVRGVRDLLAVPLRRR